LSGQTWLSDFADFGFALGFRDAEMVVPTKSFGSALLVDPARRGYHAVYRTKEINRCPACGRTHWLIGRVTAECAFCATALPLAEASLLPRHAPIFVRGFSQACAA